MPLAFCRVNRLLFLSLFSFPSFSLFLKIPSSPCLKKKGKSTFIKLQNHTITITPSMANKMPNPYIKIYKYISIYVYVYVYIYIYVFMYIYNIL